MQIYILWGCSFCDDYVWLVVKAELTSSENLFGIFCSRAQGKVSISSMAKSMSIYIADLWKEENYRRDGK